MWNHAHSVFVLRKEHRAFKCASCSKVAVKCSIDRLLQDAHLESPNLIIWSLNEKANMLHWHVPNEYTVSALKRDDKRFFRSSATTTKKKKTVTQTQFPVYFVQWCFSFSHQRKRKTSSQEVDQRQREERVQLERDGPTESWCVFSMLLPAVEGYLPRHLRWWDTICCSTLAGNSSAAAEELELSWGCRCSVQASENVVPNILVAPLIALKFNEAICWRRQRCCVSIDDGERDSRGRRKGEEGKCSGLNGRRESESAWRDGFSWWWGLSL